MLIGRNIWSYAWSNEVMHCFIQNVSCSLGGGMGHGWEGEAQERGGLGGSGGGRGRAGRGDGKEGGGGRLRTGGRETQTGDQWLSVISCSKYLDKLDRQIMRYIEEMCETLLWKSVISLEGPWPLLEVLQPQRERPLGLLWKKSSFPSQ